MLLPLPHPSSHPSSRIAANGLSETASAIPRGEEGPEPGPGASAELPSLAALLPLLSARCYGLNELWLRGVCLEPHSLLALAALPRLRVLALGNACSRLDNAALRDFLHALPQATWHPIRQRQPFSGDALSPTRFGPAAGPSSDAEDGFTAASITHLEARCHRHSASGPGELPVQLQRSRSTGITRTITTSRHNSEPSMYYSTITSRHRKVH